jgi:hypothetical protein
LIACFSPKILNDFNDGNEIWNILASLRAALFDGGEACVAGGINMPHCGIGLWLFKKLIQPNLVTGVA